MSTKELQEALTNKHLYITRITDNIAEAEKWFNDRFEVVLISKGQIWMRKNVEDALLCWKITNDKDFREKMEREHGYSTADLYKGKMP
ncbi:MAG: hypothetical protein ABSC20_00450 [Candidatus Bathyarchaeia archaeon]|jgi:hypothetical protein